MSDRLVVRIVDPLPVDWQPYPASRGPGKASEALRRIGEQVSRGGPIGLGLALLALPAVAKVPSAHRPASESESHCSTESENCA